MVSLVTLPQPYFEPDAPWGPRAILPLRSYTRPPTVIGKLKGDHQQLDDLEMSWHLQALGKALHHITQETWERTPIPLGNRVHPYQPGDEVGVKIEKRNHFSHFGQVLTWSSWQPVLLLKVIGVIPWIHHTRVMKAAASCDEDTWKAVRDLENLLNLCFRRQEPSPTKDAEPLSSHSRSWLVNARQKPEDSSALLRPQSGS